MTNLRALVVCGGIASLLAIAAAPAIALGPTHQRTERATVRGSVTALSVRDDVGDITVMPGSVTRIVAIEHYNSEAPTLVHTLRDGVLSVSAPCPRPTGPVNVQLGFNNCWVDLAITVPRDVTVNARDSVGDIRIRDLSGVESVHSDDGDLTLTGVAAPTLTATSDTGTIRLVSVRSRALTLRNSDGDIHADLATMPRSVFARNDTGDIDLTLPVGIYALDLHSADGGTHVDGITARSDAPRTLSAHTSDGDIRITGR